MPLNSAKELEEEEEEAQTFRLAPQLAVWVESISMHVLKCWPIETRAKIRTHSCMVVVSLTQRNQLSHMSTLSLLVALARQQVVPGYLVLGQPVAVLIGLVVDEKWHRPSTGSAGCILDTESAGQRASPELELERPRGGGGGGGGTLDLLAWCASSENDPAKGRAPLARVEWMAIRELVQNIFIPRTADRARARLAGQSGGRLGGGRGTGRAEV